MENVITDITIKELIDQLDHEIVSHKWKAQLAENAIIRNDHKMAAKKLEIVRAIVYFKANGRIESKLQEG